MRHVVVKHALLILYNPVPFHRLYRSVFYNLQKAIVGFFPHRDFKGCMIGEFSFSKWSKIPDSNWPFQFGRLTC